MRFMFMYRVCWVCSCISGQADGDWRPPRIMLCRVRSAGLASSRGGWLSWAWSFMCDARCVASLRIYYTHRVANPSLVAQLSRT